MIRRHIFGCNCDSLPCAQARRDQRTADAIGIAAVLSAAWTLLRIIFQ